MPTYSRRYLRQTLGRSYVRDTLVRRATNTTTHAPGNVAVIDTGLADLSLSGQGLHAGAWLMFSSAEREYRVATFNVGTGALISQANSTATILNAGNEFELHTVLPPSDKDRALDDAVGRLRARQEVGIHGAVGAAAYAVPADVAMILDAYYYATPGASVTSPPGTTDRGRTRFDDVRVVATATGLEVRVSPAIGASMQLVLDAIVPLTLGTADEATVNIPDERLVLYAAEAKCWELVSRRAPRGTADEYRRLRDDAARQYAALARNFKVPVDRPIRLGEVY